MSSSILTVSTAAADRSLLTIEELRQAAGVSGSGQDGNLTTLGARVAASLARACGIRQSGATPATFRLETLSEVFRLSGCARSLQLSRWPVTAIDSVTEDGVAVEADDYEVNPSNGILTRLSADSPVDWSARKVTIVYQAGWDEVPDDLKAAAAKLARDQWFADGPDGRDPNLKRVRVEGVDEVEYWVAPVSDPLLSAELRDLLADHIRTAWQ